MSKAEENRHVSLCLEDAMKETNELKSQVWKYGVKTSFVSCLEFDSSWTSLCRDSVFIQLNNYPHRFLGVITSDIFSLFRWLVLAFDYCSMVFRLFCFLCFTPSVSLTGFYTDNEPKSSTVTLSSIIFLLNPILNISTLKAHKLDNFTDRAVFNWLSKNQNQSNYSDQSQREQTAPWTNHNS